jgi:pimeloyl-ACP methyl ester carboxylesterase
MTTNQTHPTTSSKPAARTDPTKNTPDAVRPFSVSIPDAELADLRRRLAATRWPDKETVADPSQGAQLADLQELVRYWGSQYDWRKGEAKLNAFPQFMTTIDGVDLHFIHVRSPHENAMPLLIAHGWPGSVFEQLELIGPLTEPAKHGGRAADAFDVVIPSLPGFGFSSRPTEIGWDIDRTARGFAVLMRRLGYRRYVAQGGDWGAGIVTSMARQKVEGLLSIHSNLPATIPPEVEAMFHGGPAAKLSETESASVAALGAYVKGGGLAYLTMMGARPQAVGYALTDSPAGLAGWMLQHSGFAGWRYGRDPDQSPTKDDVLDDFTLYWLTNTATSSGRFYWENRDKDLISATSLKSAEVDLPVAITVFPEEVYRSPESWSRRAFRNLSYYNEADRGGHFAAWEYPELFASELRAAFRPLH